jgi:beta-glucosidase
VTENGAAFTDKLVMGRVADTKRTDYLRSHIDAVLRARQEGVPVNGYFAWSLTDNFEWTEGYKARFGLVYVDYVTQRRFIKDSGYWYSQFIHAFEANQMKGAQAISGH